MREPQKWKPYPSKGEIETAFSELLAVTERIRNYVQPGDSALVMLERDILRRLR
jgi:hypothetical protein